MQLVLGSPSTVGVRRQERFCKTASAIYDEAVDTTVRPYQPDLVSLPQVGADPPQLVDLVDDYGREILRTLWDT